MFYLENLLSIWGSMFLPWALLLALAPLLVFLICIVVFQLNKPGTSEKVDIYRPLPGVQTAGKRWAMAGWAMLFMAIVMYLLDACLFAAAMKKPGQSTWGDKMLSQWEKVLKKHSQPLPEPAESLVLWGQKTGLDRGKELLSIFPADVQDKIFGALTGLDETHQDLFDICQEFGMSPALLPDSAAAIRGLAKNAGRGNAERLWAYAIPKSWQMKARDRLLGDAYRSPDPEYYDLHYGHKKWFKWMLANLWWVRYCPFAIVWGIVASCVIVTGQKTRRSKRTTLLSKKTQVFLRNNMP